MTNQPKPDVANFDVHAWLRDRHKPFAAFDKLSAVVTPLAETMIKESLTQFEAKADVTFALIANPALNAVAEKPTIKKDRHYSISLFSGLANAIYDDARRSAEQIPFFNTLLSFNPQMNVKMRREKIAHFLSTLSLYFIMSHEVSHVINGHLDLCQKAGWGLLLSELELDAEAPTKIPNLERQMMELNADSTAAVLGVHTILGDPPSSLMGIEVDGALQYLFAAMFSVLTMFGPKEYDLDHLERNSHPPAFLRILSLRDGLIDYIGRKFPNRFKRPILELANEVLLLTPAMAPRSGNAFAWDNYINQMTDARVGEHFKRLLQTWIPIKAKLEPVKLGGNFAIGPFG